MNRKGFWLAIVVVAGAAIVSIAVSRASGEKGSASAKAFTPRSLALAGNAAASARAGGASAGSDAAVIAQGVPITPTEYNGDLRNLPKVPDAAVPLSIERDFAPTKPPASSPPPGVPAPSVSMPSPTVSFDGLTRPSVANGWPPDTVGDVGPSYYIQGVNTSFAIYNKTGGAPVVQMTFRSLFTPLGGLCATGNLSDPTVVYDQQGSRWILGMLAYTGNATVAPYAECIAVSQTSDPVVGGWYLYSVPVTDDLPDYPKMGIWPDGLYMSANLFAPPSLTYAGVRVWAFNRTQLEAGGPVSYVTATSTNTSRDFGFLPANLRGTPPPVGTDELVVAESGTQYAFNVWKFHVVYGAPGSTFTGPVVVNQTTYLYPPTCFVAPGCLVPTPVNAVDSLSDRLMMQAQYRNIGGTESLWVTHDVGLSSTSNLWGTQWAQLNVTGGTIPTTPVQQQIYGNVGGDGVNRWMSSLAVDYAGNMSLGYSAANANVNPDIRYAGRLVGDPLNALPQGETSLLPSPPGGTQSGACSTQNPCHRWGDYSAMTVDVDGCTFWYTTEYYPVSGVDWFTRIGSFAYPTLNCAPIPTAVGVARLGATRTKAGIVVSWRTAAETQTVGFNLWRNGRKVNRALVPAKRTGQASGASYRFLDRAARIGGRYTYRLQVVNLQGKRSWYPYSTAAALR